MSIPRMQAAWDAALTADSQGGLAVAQAVFAAGAMLERELSAARGWITGDSVLIGKLQSRINQLAADLARVTAERDEAEENVKKGVVAFLNEQFCCSGRECGCMGVSRLEQLVLEEAGSQLAALRARVAEVEEQAERYRLVTLRQDATIAELVAALRFIREECDWEPYRDRGGDVRIGEVCDKALGVSTQRLPQEPCGGRCGDADCDLDTNGQALARAESAEHKSKTDPSLSEIRMSESSTPVKHPDTEREWQTGAPDVPAGAMRRLWCAVLADDGKIYHSMLCYANGYAMQLADWADEIPDCCKPIDGDEDNLAWFGWYEESCDHCETQWHSHANVVAWMELPKYDASNQEAAR